MALTLLSGCGNEPSNSSKIDYASIDEASSDLTKYTNADWLFQNYFGEYGLPEEMKSMMLPELMMVANGFALQHAKGEDVEASISELHSAMQMLHYSGELGMMMSNVQEDFSNGLHLKNNSNEMLNEELIPRETNATVRAKISESKQHHKEYVKAQIKLVEKYNLPYLIPDRDTQTFTYSQNMKSSDKEETNPNSHAGLDRWDWATTDIIWVDGAKGIGHMAILTGFKGNLKEIVDANTGAGVARHTGIDNWANRGGYSRVEARRYHGYAHRANVVAYAESKVGQTYNWNFWNKGSDSKSYCSQLIWKAYDSVAVNLDRDGGLVVWPNDIRFHPLVREFKHSQI